MIRESIENLKTDIEDIEYLKQRMFYKTGVLPSQLDGEEMQEILEMNSAKPRDKRAVNGAEWIHSLLHGGDGHVN